MSTIAHRKYLSSFTVFHSNSLIAYHSIPLPPGASFELKQAAPGKGWGAYATKPIRKGDVIMEELPIFLTKTLTVATAEENITMACQRMSLAEKHLAGLARDNGGAMFDSPVPFFLQNSFNVGDTMVGFYLVQSRFNHSCRPNSAVPHAEGPDDILIKRFALKDIEVGEEITFCYQPGFGNKTRLERHQLLSFECLCECCTLDAASQQLSDLRRTFMKALDYLAFGAFPNGEIDDSDHPLICDPDLKLASESQALPISNKFVYHILYMHLAEQEQMKTDLMLSRLCPRIDTLARSFETERNIRISCHALHQKTWLEKLDVALTMLGEPDEGDDAYNEEVCKIRNARMGQYLNGSIF